MVDRKPRIEPGVAEKVNRAQWIPDHWEHFGICVLAHLLLPLIPLLLELAIASKISAETLYLTASMYTLSVSMASSKIIGVIFGVVVGVVFSAFYGVLARDQVLFEAMEASSSTVLLPPNAWIGGVKLPAITIGIVFVLHMIDRFRLHITERAPFFEFSKDK